MVASAIRHLATATNSHKLAAAKVKRTVQLWDLHTHERNAEFETVFDFGGRRLALSPGGELLVAASWTKDKRGGVACYHAESGQTLWHRTDIRHAQRLRISLAGDCVWCGLEEGPLQCLSATTGMTVETRRGLHDIVESPYSAYQLLDTRDDTLIVMAKREIRIRRSTFALLDVAFGPDALCLSEAGGAVRCVDCCTGNERLRYQPVAGHHVLTLAYRSLDGHYYGIEWEYQRGKSRYLVRLDGQTGRCEHICLLTSWEEKFDMLGERIVTSSGDILDVNTGNVVTRLPFPETDYPDPQ